MKKKTIFASVLLLLLLATSTAFACPPEFTEFTTTGWTTFMSEPVFLPDGRMKLRVRAEGTVSSDCKQSAVCFDGADFSFREWIVADPVTYEAINGGILTITANDRRGSKAVFAFGGTADAFTVQGRFRALRGTGRYRGLSGRGSYDGVPDLGEGFWVTYTGRLATNHEHD